MKKARSTAFEYIQLLTTAEPVLSLMALKEDIVDVILIISGSDNRVLTHRSNV